jgi:hypothetical protein
LTHFIRKWKFVSISSKIHSSINLLHGWKQAVAV